MADHNRLERVGQDHHLVQAHVPVAHFELAPVKKHEGSQINLGAIVKTVLWMFAIIFISQGLVFGLMKYWGGVHRAEQAPTSPLLAIQPPPTDVQLQVDEKRFLRNQQEAAAEVLESYKPVNGAPGKFQIPIGEAMSIIAKSGKLPEGPEWALKPDEKMVGGVILNAEQVKYANTPPSAAQVEDYSKPGTLMTPAIVSPAAGETPKPPTAAAPAEAKPAAKPPAKPAAKPAAPVNP